MSDTIHSTPVTDIKSLRIQTMIKLIAAFLLLAAMFFLPAGSFAYWQAWIFIGILIIPASCVMVYLLRHDPELLARRTQMKEKEQEQKTIIKAGLILFFMTYLIPGFDYRYGWSVVPVVLVIIGDILILLGYGLFVLVLRENRYASRTVEVVEDQKVISTGPYAVVRHPMYSAVFLIYGFSPIALGSYWAFPGTVLLLAIIVARIFNEEKVLARDLKGYSEYLQHVKYRIIPGVW
jgi:protein-S-isoprenylcysteine O-methyltransferase Ste14